MKRIIYSVALIIAIIAVAFMFFGEPQPGITDQKLFVLSPPTDAIQVPALHSTNDPVPLAAGSIAPDFTVADVTGKPVKLSDFKGKVVVLDFWSSWCPYCQDSMPHTCSIARKYSEQGVVFLAVNTRDTQVAFDEWLPRHTEYSAMNYVIDVNPPEQAFAKTLYNAPLVPSWVVINKAGVIVKTIVGFPGPNDDLENGIKAAQS